MGKIIDESINENIKKLIENLEKRGIHVNEVILFGSRSRGEALKYSDVDLIIVSEDWREVPFGRRIQIIQECWESDIIGLDGFGYTKEELEKGRSFVLISSALEEGTRIKVNADT